MKIGSLFTGIGGLELGVFNTVTSIVPYDNNIEWIAETDGNALKILEHWSEDEVRASYGAAIERWEQTLGRKAPLLTKPKGVLNIEFIEWMMGFPKGWVTDVDDVSRTAKLAALGNACTPQQASEAFYHGLMQLTRERTN